MQSGACRLGAAHLMARTNSILCMEPLPRVRALYICTSTCSTSLVQYQPWYMYSSGSNKHATTNKYKTVSLSYTVSYPIVELKS